LRSRRVFYGIKNPEMKQDSEQRTCSQSYSPVDPELACKVAMMSLQIASLQRDLKALKPDDEECVPKRLLHAVESQLNAVLIDKEELIDLRNMLLAELRRSQHKLEEVTRLNSQLKRKQTHLSGLQDPAGCRRREEESYQQVVDENGQLRTEVNTLGTRLLDLDRTASALEKRLQKSEASSKEKEGLIKVLEEKVRHQGDLIENSNTWIKEWLEVTALTLQRQVEEVSDKHIKELEIISLSLEAKTYKLKALQDSVWECSQHCDFSRQPLVDELEVLSLERNHY
jgi:hypothetical protein